MSKAESLPFEITLHVRDTCLCLYVQRAARAVARFFDEALKPLALTNGQFSLLMSLNRPDTASMREVCRVLVMDRTTLTANLKPLERRGLVRVMVDPADRRSRRLTLTEEGRTLLAAAYPIWVEKHAELEGLLGGANADRLRADLRAISAGAPVLNRTLDRQQLAAGDLAEA